MDQGNTMLMFIDVQGKLAELMHDRESLFDNLRRAVQGAKALNLPVVWTEQIPEKMGPTLPAFAELLADNKPLSKTTFSCCGDPNIMQAVRSTGRKHVFLAGIETHVCVLQTSADLLRLGYTVEVLADCVSSRTALNRQIALDQMRSMGVTVSTVEIVLFRLMKAAAHPAFRDILKIVR